MLDLGANSAFAVEPRKTKIKLVYVGFNESVRTAKKAPHSTITKINWLPLFKKITAVYNESHMKHKYKTVHTVTTGVNNF
jgi:hypothetical protein